MELSLSIYLRFIYTDCTRRDIRSVVNEAGLPNQPVIEGSWMTPADVTSPPLMVAASNTSVDARWSRQADRVFTDEVITKLIKAIVTDGAEIKEFPMSPRARSESSFKSTHRRRGRRDARRLHGPAGLSEHTAPPRC